MDCIFKMLMSTSGAMKMKKESHYFPDDQKIACLRPPKPTVMRVPGTTPPKTAGNTRILP
jgi:hypothetical protein